MTRRVYENRESAAAPVKQDAGENPGEPRPPRGFRVAGEVREREYTEVQRIAGVLEVTNWIKRMFPPAR